MFFLLFFSRASALKFDSVSWDAGKINLTCQLEKKVTAYSDSSEIIELRTRASCDCISVFPKTLSLLPGAAGTFRIVFNPDGEKGDIKHSVYFETSSSGDDDFVNYILSAEVDPVFDIYFFYDENCANCAGILKNLEKLRDKYPFNLKKLLVSESRNFEFLSHLEKISGSRNDKFPVLAAGNKILAGAREINTGAEKALSSFKSAPPETAFFNSSASRDDILNDFGKVKFFPVVAAALIDGINPCAFAGIIFLVSYMSFVMKKQKKEVAVFGAGYCAGVGVFYFLFGLGIFEIVKSLVFMKTISGVFYFSMSLVTAALCVGSVRDAVVFGRGGETVLKVPDAMRAKMRETSSKMLAKGTAFFYAFLIGGVVSSFELVCTGQIYLPTISYVVSVTSYRAEALGALFLYSVFFTVPLFAVFVFVFAGINSVEMITFLKKHVVAAKLFNAVLFGAFAVYLFVFALKGM
ncbi:MAG: hypothetical protein U9O97_02815 [Elusimicrobiota bacterium]|nr:hypothetical protein [Elusimicrobiota bacterium]